MHFWDPILNDLGSVIDWGQNMIKPAARKTVCFVHGHVPQFTTDPEHKLLGKDFFCQRCGKKVKHPLKRKSRRFKP